MEKIILNRGDIIFFYPRSKLQKAIAYFDGKYFHTGIMITSDLILSQTYKGLVIENIHKAYNGHFVDIFRIRDVDNKEITEIIRFIMSQNYPYDFGGVLNFVFRWIPNNPRRFYCSEIIAFALLAFGIWVEDVRLSPLALSNQEVMEYQGTIQIGG